MSSYRVCKFDVKRDVMMWRKASGIDSTYFDLYFIGVLALENPKIDTKIDVLQWVVPEIDLRYFWRQAWRHDVT